MLQNIYEEVQSEKKKVQETFINKTEFLQE